MTKPQADRNDPSPHSRSAPQAGQAVASSRQSRPVSTHTVSEPCAAQTTSGSAALATTRWPGRDASICRQRLATVPTSP